MPPPSVYFVMAEIGDETCYMRYLGTYSLDSVCTRGNDIRYSPVPIAAQQQRAMPGYVTALFNGASIEDLLASRRASQGRMPTRPETAPR